MGRNSSCARRKRPGTCGSVDNTQWESCLSLLDFWLHRGLRKLSISISLAHTGFITILLARLLCVLLLHNRLDGKHVVFGIVTQGMDVVRAIEGVGSQSGATKAKVLVQDCGQL
jgi:cyclophilin family peptidyl-prolyl cis-trans isomerase